MNYNYKQYNVKNSANITLEISWFAIYTNEPNLLYQIQLSHLRSINEGYKIDNKNKAEDQCSVYNSKLATKDQVLKILDIKPDQNEPDQNLCKKSGWMNDGKNGVVGYVMRNNNYSTCGPMCTNGLKNGTNYKCFKEIKYTTPTNSNVWCYGPADNITSNLSKIVDPSYKWDIDNIKK